MPVISMFYGIIIRLYQPGNRHQKLPHSHARCAEVEAADRIGDYKIEAL